MSNDLSEVQIAGDATIHYVDDAGRYMGGWDVNPPDGAIEVDPPPAYADQIWQFPGWGPSLIAMRAAEDLWREAELIVIANQLDALEEVFAGEIPADILPGTRAQWLAHRGKTRNWKEGAEGYPNLMGRPVRPS
ncbi:hypothetical protein [Pseudomonas sp. O230]|uniref:hypothetical protein n=1 Tax=Pseudomonas sp. O230 TaxID=3159450 RepID=UPI00387B5F75